MNSYLSGETNDSYFSHGEQQPFHEPGQVEPAGPEKNEQKINQPTGQPHNYERCYGDKLLVLVSMTRRTRS